METKRFVLTFEDEKVVLVQVLVMKKSCQLWLGSPDSESVSLNNMTVAMNTRFDNAPISTTLVTSDEEMKDGFSDSIGQKLAKKLDAQVFVHCSLPQSYQFLVPVIEQELCSKLTPLLGA